MPCLAHSFRRSIADLAITSLDKSDRTKCAKAFVGFIVAYPLGKKRKTHYLGKALAGLDYAYEEGRNAALELVMSVARSLPQPELDARDIPTEELDESEDPIQVMSGAMFSLISRGCASCGSPVEAHHG